MSCFGLNSNRRTKRVTVPPGLEPASVGVRANAIPQQHFSTRRSSQVMPQALHCHMYRYNELQAATNNFNSSNIIGEGGFGRVYKGQLANGTVVAVKRLDRHGLQGDLEFNVEVSIMAGLQHPNLVPLLGSCCEADQRVAVFQYMPHGNLRDMLDSKTPAARHFNWPARLNVLLGVAKGLAYLHQAANPAIIHRDLKSSNILIDAAGQARICDFGLARHKHLPHNSPAAALPAESVMMGTYGYMAPEHAASGQITDKSDVYAFGVVVLEMMTGMQAVDARRPEGCEALPQLLHPALQAVQLMQGNLDPSLNRHAALPAAQLAALGEVAAACLEHQASDRPSASQLVTYLQKLLTSTDQAAAAARRHTRTVSSPPTASSHHAVSDTPCDFHQHQEAAATSLSTPHQQRQQQMHRQGYQQQGQGHRPAQSMPHLSYLPAADEDTADSAHSPLSRGHDVRRSAGYGNELGVPGPSRHLTPLAQGLRAATLCSLPTAAAPTDVFPPSAAVTGTSHNILADLVTQDSLDGLVSAQSSPAAQRQHSPEDISPRFVMQPGTMLQSAPGSEQGASYWRRGAASRGRDLRDSAWGGMPAPVQQASAPPLPRSSSAIVSGEMALQQSPIRPANGHRPTQSMLPAYPPRGPAHLRSPSSPQDQSLHQLVRVRTLQGSSRADALWPEPVRHQPAPSSAATHQQPPSHQLAKHRSGNPFAGDHLAPGRGSGQAGLASTSSLTHAASGNPFTAATETVRESRIADSQHQAFADLCVGIVPISSHISGGHWSHDDSQAGTAAGGRMQIPSQQTLLESVSVTASPVVSPRILKDPEMSPLQNGLIRAWPSPCKVQPPEVMASSWHHFLSASTRGQAARAAIKQEPATSRQAPASTAAPARVGVCLVCLDASRDWQMVPCGHAAACKSCAEKLQQHNLPCPVCRAPVTGLCYKQFQHTFVGRAASFDGGDSLQDSFCSVVQCV